MRMKFFVKLSFFIFIIFVVHIAHAGELLSEDIGDAKKNKGSTVIEDKTYTIKGSGSDIWNKADGFRFAYTKVSGDFEAVVHQVSIDLPNEWAKGGVHARQSIELFDAAKGPWKDKECWVKLTRSNDKFQGFISEDGKKWLDLKSTTVKMDKQVLVGLAVCGLDKIATAVYDNFTITQNGKVIFPSTTAVESEGKLAITWGKIKFH